MQVIAPSDLVPVRNMQSGPTVFRDAANDVTIRWEGRGDPNGQDWQYVPEHYKQHPVFANNLRLKILAIGTLDEASDALTTSSGPSAGEALEAQAAAAIHRPEVNDFLTKTCIAPGQRAGIACGVTVPIRQSEITTTPPLCDGHKALAASYVPVAGVGANGLPETNWVQTVLAPAVTEASQTGPAPTAPGI